MSSIVPSALDPRTQLFPTLTAAQIDRIRPLGRIRKVERGEIVFQPDDHNVPFFVLLSGEMEIVQPTIDGERMIVKHGPNSFTGELTMISGQRLLVIGRVTEPGEFLELDNEALRTLVARDAELSEILLRAFILRRLELIKGGYGDFVLLGSRHSAKTLELREFLTRNGHPYTYVDLDTDQSAQQLLDRFQIKATEVPVVIGQRGDVFRNPSIHSLARCLGFNSAAESTRVRDVIIAGAGPAGLAAAVYAASEGLDALVIETLAPGGQAGSSSKIENYLGFPTGVSGLELATRALTQAQKFGANMIVARNVVGLHCSRRPFEIELNCGETLPARAIVIATGARYNRPELAKLQSFEGKGIYYGATYLEAQLCKDTEVAVVGGGNSAGQAAVYLSETARKVHMVVRGPGLADTMSRYLIQRLIENPCIEMHWKTEIVELAGDESLEGVSWQDKVTGKITSLPIEHVFVMTGASPRTDWLRGCVALDEKGFILTGRDLDNAPTNDHPEWPLARRPQMLETSLPGVFAVGDVRAGNVKRVASAVGEGAISIHLVHRFLAEL